jgi:hypothetical protein
MLHIYSCQRAPAVPVMDHLKLADLIDRREVVISVWDRPDYILKPEERSAMSQALRAHWS